MVISITGQHLNCNGVTRPGLVRSPEELSFLWKTIRSFCVICCCFWECVFLYVCLFMRKCLLILSWLHVPSNFGAVLLGKVRRKILALKFPSILTIFPFKVWIGLHFACFWKHEFLLASLQGCWPWNIHSMVKWAFVKAWSPVLIVLWFRFIYYPLNRGSFVKLWLAFFLWDSNWCFLS